MKEPKKNYRTLFAKQGRIWFKDSTKAVNRGIAPLIATHMSSEESLRIRFASLKQSKRPLYASNTEFENLKMEVKKLGEIVEEIQATQFSKENEIAVSYAISQLERIKAIELIHNNSKGRNLFFLVESKNFSENSLRKIADVEIDLARKYSEFSVEVRPIITENKKTLSE